MAKKRSTQSKSKTSKSSKSKPTRKKVRKSPKQREKAATLYDRLDGLYPDAHCALTHDNPWQLLVATILSAQCTDVRVNKVTPPLFEKYPTPGDLADAPVEDIEQMVRTTGFFRNKARNIKAAAIMVRDQHAGEVPADMTQLLNLPGVARKTANVVLGNAFNINEGVVVDTHVGRLSQRLGLTRHTDPKKIEQDLIALFEQDQWTQLSHLLIYHGRQVCASRKPKCDACTLIDLCPRHGVESTKASKPATKTSVKKKAAKKAAGKKSGRKKTGRNKAGKKKTVKTTR